MKTLYIVLIAALFFVLSCGYLSRKKESEVDELKDIYTLKLKGFYNFRRSYFGFEELEKEQLDSLYNKNPELCNQIKKGEDVIYEQLVENGIVLNGALNLVKFDTLPDQFIYKISNHRIINVKNDYIEQLKSPAFIGNVLTFIEDEKILLIDTLKFGFPPDVIFSLFDINNDGKDELFSIYKNYSLNGDNFLLQIFELENHL